MTKLASFDVFDTLVCRLVDAPRDVFRLMEAEHSGKGMVPVNFSALRVSAEVQARRSRKGEDVSLIEIYQALGTVVAPVMIDAAALMSLEIETEIRLCRPREDVVSVLAQFQDSGVRCIAISDMYLPGDAVQRILDSCGITVDALYVSSDIGFTKASGRLYGYVRQAESLALSDIWHHHGDNFRSDVESAIVSGLMATHCPIEDFRLTEKPSAAYSLFESIIDGTSRYLGYKHRGSGLSSAVWSQTGARYTGPLGILLCDLARRKADSTGAKSIFFLARDGFVLKRLYETLFPNDSRKLVYLAGSRRMINFVQTSEDNDNLDFLSANCVGLTGQELLDRISVPVPDSDSLLSAVITTKQQGIAILERYSKEILAQASFEKEQVDAYLTDAGLISDDASVIVDVGWFCSIQKTLTKMIKAAGRHGSLHGVYFGTNVASSPDFDVEGLFYTNRQPLASASVITQHIEVMELLFTAPEQSVTSVQKDVNGFRILRMESTEELSRIYAAEEIIAGATAFAATISEANLGQHLLDAAALDKSLRRFALLVADPNRDIVACVKGIKHSVGFGGSRYESFLGRNEPTKDPLKLIHAFLTSYWQAALFRDLTPKERLIISPPVLVLFKGAFRIASLLPKSLKERIKASIRKLSPVGGV
jgi:predicted HAD superfamily hydrolase